MMNMLLNNTAGEQWDIVFSGTPLQLQMVLDDNYIAQKVKQLLLTGLGEVFFDSDTGVPWLDGILGVKNPDLANIRTMVVSVLTKDSVLKELGATSISIGSITLDKTTRRLTISDLVVSKDDTATVNLGRIPL